MGEVLRWGYVLRQPGGATAAREVLRQGRCYGGVRRGKERKESKVCVRERRVQSGSS